jgi:outer membrane protein
MLVFSHLGVSSLKKNLFVLPALLLAVTVLVHAQAAAPLKIGIIHVQAAILGTKDGQKAAAELNAKIAPRKSELEKKQAAIEALQEQLRKGSATMSEDAKSRIMRDIDSNTKALNRDNEDAQADIEQEESKIFNDLGAKLYAVVEKYAKDNGFSMILDVSAQQQPVWWASDSINITTEVVALYDKAHPAGAASVTAAPAAPRPAAPAAPVTRPAVPPAAPPAPKKQ